MKTLTRKLVIGTAHLSAVFLLGYFGAGEFKRRSLSESFKKIRPGESKSDVIDLLGEPGEIETCKGSETCKDVFLYYTFLERRGIVFDRDDRVIDKYYNVSY